MGVPVEGRHFAGWRASSGWDVQMGQIGGWREEFSPEHERAFKEVADPLLVELGYEANPNW